MTKLYTWLFTGWTIPQNSCYKLGLSQNKVRMLYPFISEWYGRQGSGICVFMTLLGNKKALKTFFLKNTVCVYDMYTDTDKHVPVLTETCVSSSFLILVLIFSDGCTLRPNLFCNLCCYTTSFIIN